VQQKNEPAFWRDPRFNQPDQPVVGVCWYEAMAFARWLREQTKRAWRLPTEVEWEAAARGAGNTAPLIDLSRLNSAELGLGHPWAVQHGAVSWCGAVNLLGNVWEWTSSRWGRNWQTMDYGYPYSLADDRESPDDSHARVMRGGSWFDAATEAQPTTRARYLPGSRASNIGFRLAHNGA
ncbi:MAG: SUMF1/EgtB/PvdO family nonheme iron enzyme, partial [bacterium]|nr:SUMF1/EgtB/PvdO family nonheme iron enzyme [bacterium]